MRSATSLLSRAPGAALLGIALLGASLLAAPVAAHAQGAVSQQGLGFPPGQLSTRALTTGGALGEFDANSPLNPAALEGTERSSLFFQYEPEYRRVTVGGRDVSTRTSRFPLVGGTLRLTDRSALAVTASTLLDRSWRTTRDTTRTIDSASVPTSESFSVLGAITDLQLAGSWQPFGALRVGAGVHGYTGQNQVDITGTFGDSTPLQIQRDVIGFRGAALSAGVSWRLSSALSLAGSARKGGSLKATRGDETIGSARVPDRLGAGVRYTGLRGTALAANVDWTGWSKLGGLVSSDTKVYDGWDMGAGADVAGPRFASRVIMMRGGVRWRTLPFGVGDTEVKELGLSFGAGVPLAQNRATLDLGFLHANRTAGSVATERAWTVSVGVSVRP